MVSLAGMIVCRFIKNRFTPVAVCFLILLSCNENKQAVKETLPFYNSAEFDAEWINENDARYATIHTIDTFSLTDQSGHVINKDSLAGHIYVANFFFTSCSGICPKMVNCLHELQDSFANDPRIKLVSFSVMPWADSVSVLNTYGKEHKIDPAKWHLLTGGKERIYTLGRQSYFAEKTLGVQKVTTEFLHTETMLLIDSKSRIRGIYNATQKTDIERVSDDIRTLLNE